MDRIDNSEAISFYQKLRGIARYKPIMADKIIKD